MIIIFILQLFTLILNAQSQADSLFEDIQYQHWEASTEEIFFTSAEVDFVQIPSSIADSVRFAMVVYKPKNKSRILLLSHGWHMSIKPPQNSDNPFPDFLTIQVDMRGRKYSTGKQDCNGYELYDFYDAYQYALSNYEELIIDPQQVYFYGASGGGGNGYGLVGKFPDLFCSAVILAGMSDYAKWYAQDKAGEFRDEMLPWIGGTPEEMPLAYESRSGISTINNVLTPLYIIHGETDVRVPVSHGREYVAKAQSLAKEIYYLELANVGTRAHWGNITTQQQIKKNEFEKNGLRRHSAPTLNRKGELVVTGYVVTDHFEVFMDSIDSIGRISYDLSKKQMKWIEGNGELKWKK